MKIIVTGADGFVGRHLVNLLKKSSKDEVVGLDRNEADITDFSSVKKFLAKIQPDQIYHLAGFASGAGKDKDLIFKVNVDGTLNILKALKEIGKPVKVLITSTAYVYGNTPTCATESSETKANSFYDQSKLEMEKRVQEYNSGSIQIVITRATNHSGPGQKLGFAVPDFCSQIAGAKDGDKILTGNLDAYRDLFDVRDCVSAYKVVMEKGVSGETYNIGTGQAIQMKEVLAKIIKISGKDIQTELDPNKMRPSDIEKNCVDPTKINQLGWKPEISLDKTLEDTYEFYKNA